MSDDRRYDIRVTILRNPPSNPNGSETALVARALRMIAGNLEHHKKLGTTGGELFDYEHRYGYWNLRPVIERDERPD